jgi:hypothetical protein
MQVSRINDLSGSVANELTGFMVHLGLMFRFEEAYQGWQEKKFTQEDAARLLGVSDRTFRGYLVDYKEQGLEGLVDARWSQISHRKAPVNEVMEVTELYSERYLDGMLSILPVFIGGYIKELEVTHGLKLRCKMRDLLRKRQKKVLTENAVKGFLQKA